MLVLLVGPFVGCMVTETGNPTAIDAKSIYLRKMDSGVRMVGEKGAVTPGGSRLRIIDLDSLSEPVTITVEKDGSFQVDLEGAMDHVYRLRAIKGDDRSDPVNISGIPIEEANCIEVDPPLVLVFPDTQPGEVAEQQIALTNTCNQTVQLVEQGFRLRSAAIVMDELSQLQEIGPGERIVVDVSFTPEWPGIYDAIVVFRFSSEGRVVVDITGTAPGGSNQASSQIVQAGLGVCYGENTNCKIELQPLVSGYPIAKSASSNQAEYIPIDWITIIKEVDCPLAPCYLTDPKISVSKDGWISVAALVSANPISRDHYEVGPQAYEMPGLGIWFGHFSPEGEKMAEELVDFTIPGSTVMTEHLYSLAVDSKGDTFIAHLTRDHTPNSEIKKGGELSIYNFDPEGQLLGIPITRYGVQEASIFIDPFDDIILIAKYSDPQAADQSTDPDSESEQALFPLSHVDVSKYKNSGELVFNQVGLNEDGFSTEIVQVDFDAKGNCFALVKQIDRIDLWSELTKWQLYRMDRDGNFQYIRLLSDPEETPVSRVKIVVSPDGSWSVLIELLTGYVLEKYNPQGGALWSWEIRTMDEDSVSHAYGDVGFIDLFNGSKGEVLAVLSNDSFNSLLYSFTPQGDSFSISTITDTDCGGRIVNRNLIQRSGVYEDGIEMAECSLSTSAPSPGGQIYFGSSFEEGISLDNADQKTIYSEYIDSEYIGDEERKYTFKTGVIAIGMLSISTED